MEKRKKILISIVLILIFIISGCSVKTEDKYLVKNHLDDVIVKIDDVEYCFGDIGYYITNGEATVESQALVYNPDISPAQRAEGGGRSGNIRWRGFGRSA